MNARRWLAVLALGLVAGCNAERKQECDQLLSVTQPLETGSPPNPEGVDRAQASVSAIQFQDEPLREYASNVRQSLKALASTLRVQAGPTPPDGTDDLVKAKIKEVHGERDDVTRYCAQ
jgi:hypothetical protein